MAPTAFWRGGFVALDVISGFMSKRVAAVLSLILLLISILIVAVQIGFREVTGFGGRFATASLYLPTFDDWLRVPRSWMMLSLAGRGHSSAQRQCRTDPAQPATNDSVSCPT